MVAMAWTPSQSMTRSSCAEMTIRMQNISAGISRPNRPMIEMARRFMPRLIRTVAMHEDPLDTFNLHNGEPMCYDL